MTVAELIERLKQMPADAVVYVVDGGCCGCRSKQASEVMVTEKGRLHTQDHARVDIE